MAVVQNSLSGIWPTLAKEAFAEPIFTCGSTWGINLDANI